MIKFFFLLLNPCENVLERLYAKQSSSGGKNRCTNLNFSSSYSFMHFWSFMEFLINKKNFFFLFPFTDFKKNLRIQKTLNTSSSKVFTSSLLIVLIFSAICDVTGKSQNRIISMKKKKVHFIYFNSDSFSKIKKCEN